MLCNLDSKNASNVAEGMDDEEYNQDLEGMVPAEEVAMPDICGKLQVMQRVCEDNGKTVPTGFVDVIEQACDAFEAKRKNAILSNRNKTWKPDS